MDAVVPAGVRGSYSCQPELTGPSSGPNLEPVAAHLMPPAARKPPEQVAAMQLQVTLNDIEPPSWRRFWVEESITLGRRHEVLQIVMGWQNCHLHQFISGERFEEQIFYTPPCGGGPRPAAGTTNSGPASAIAEQQLAAEHHRKQLLQEGEDFAQPWLGCSMCRGGVISRPPVRQPEPMPISAVGAFSSGATGTPCQRVPWMKTSPKQGLPGLRYRFRLRPPSTTPAPPLQ